MNTINKIKFFILAVAGMVTLNSCVQDDEFALPPIVCNDTWDSNLTIAELFTMVDTSTEDILSFETDQIIEGYVVSSDSTGNFFKTVSIQDHPTTPTRALQVEMDKTNLFNNFPLGSKIQVNLKGLNVGYDRGALKVGQTYVDGGGSTRVGRMDEYKIEMHVAKTCEPRAELTPVVYNSIGDAISGANANGRINTLITINNVQFAETGVTYANAPQQQTIDLTLVGSTAETNGGSTIVLRTSGYADFAATVVPEGSGSITAVLSKYNSTWQLYIRDTNDVKFDQPRFGDGGGEPGSDSFACLNENFTAYSVNNETFANYENLAVQGTRKWRVREFSANKYIEVSAFQTTGTIFSYFVVPVNFDAADSFSFKTKDGHNNGNALKIYYSTNYELGGNINNATLVDITSSFTLATGTTSGYAANFTDSGSYNLAALNGQGVIIFAYEGGNGVTTTFQIDDIKITDNENPDCN